MNRFKSAFILIVCFLAGIGLARVVMTFWHRSPPEEPRFGVGNPPAFHGFSLPATAKPSDMDPLTAFHTSAIAIQYAEPAPLRAMVTHAHALHFKVTLVPPGDFSLQSPYPKPLATIADDAQAAGVDLLCISWLNDDPDDAFWKPQIADIRKHFKGQIILAATPDIIPGIEFLPAIDMIGVIGPIDLPRRLPHAAVPINLHDLRIAWACQLDSFESLGTRFGKNIALLNMSVSPEITTKIPLTAADKPTPDPLLQALAYEALLTETRGRNVTSALYLRWSPQKNADDIAPEPDAANHLPAVLDKLHTLWLPGAAATAPAPETEPGPDTDDDDPPDTNP